MCVLCFMRIPKLGARNIINYIRFVFFNVNYQQLE